NEGNLGVADELIVADAVEHEEFPGLEGSGPEVAKQFVAIIRSAFPDVRVQTQDMIAEGDKVVARVTLTGTHRGEFLGIPPTGKQVEVSTIDIIRVADGKMVEHWGVTDNLGMMQQLGVVPAPGQ
ncbi:MAG TPA: ester cyclase, partial [Anaerolineae bacterium]